MVDVKDANCRDENSHRPDAETLNKSTRLDDYVLVARPLHTSLPGSITDHHSDLKWRPIMNRLFLASCAICLTCVTAIAQTPPLPQSQPGTAAQIGEKIERGLNQIGAELSQAWADVRKSVEKMGVQGRVYGRLHWDKALENATLDIEVRDGQVVVLKGKVDTAAAKVKAEQLARDTIGVSSVVNEVAVTSVSSR